MSSRIITAYHISKSNEKLATDGMFFEVLLVYVVPVVVIEPCIPSVLCILFVPDVDICVILRLESTRRFFDHKSKSELFLPTDEELFSSSAERCCFC